MVSVRNSVRPNHLFDHSCDHDYYFELPCEGERDAQSRLRITGHFWRQELQPNEAMQAGVLGLVHNAHAAAAEFLNDAVVRDGLADHWRKPYVRQRDQV